VKDAGMSQQNGNVNFSDSFQGNMPDLQESLLPAQPTQLTGKTDESVEEEITDDMVFRAYEEANAIR